MSFDVIDETNVYLCVGHPLKKDIKNIVEWMLNRDFGAANKCKLFDRSKNPLYTDLISAISDLKVNKGLALQDILTEVHNYVHRSEKLWFFFVV